VADIGFILILVAFFALAAAFVGACDRIIGSSAAFDGEGRDGAPEPSGPERPQPESGTAAEVPA
jgi:hypothetical protein